MNTWTNHEIERLKALHAQGFSNSQIATEFGTSRNAIIGKLTRLNGHAVGAAPLRLAKAVSMPAPPPPEALPVVSEKDVDHETTSTAISLFDIGYGQCRWPLNDVNPISEFRFCGAKSQGSWCETHKALGWAKR